VDSGVGRPLPDTSESVEPYFSGEKLYGDDFAQQQLEDWFADEREAYAAVSSEAPYAYKYHALDWQHGFRWLRDGTFRDVLGVGSAYGDEFVPILERAERITIVEPSDSFSRPDLAGKPLRYVRPVASGSLPFAEESFDLCTCFGVLHHVANVSHVVTELFRCLRPGGYLLVREPVTSMGDWRKRRQGLSKRERGIPLRSRLRARAGDNVHVLRDIRIWPTAQHRGLQQPDPGAD
jgi:SAM-dependent methyltransferase